MAKLKAEEIKRAGCYIAAYDQNKENNDFQQLNGHGMAAYRCLNKSPSEVDSSDSDCSENTEYLGYYYQIEKDAAAELSVFEFLFCLNNYFCAFRGQTWSTLVIAFLGSIFALLSYGFGYTTHYFMSFVVVWLSAAVNCISGAVGDLVGYYHSSNNELKGKVGHHVRRFGLSKLVPGLIESKGILQGVNARTFLKGLTLNKPEGLVGHMPAKKRIKVPEAFTATCDKPQDNEVEVPLSGPRPTVKLLIENIFEEDGLLDTGANSSLLSRDLFEKLKMVKDIPCLKNDCTITGLVSKTKPSQVVLLDIVIGSKISLREVPFIVIDGMTQPLIIGSNIINSCRLSSQYDQNGIAYLTFEVSQDFRGRIDVEYTTFDKLEVVSVCEVTLEPKSIKLIELEIPKLRKSQKNNLEGKAFVVRDESDDETTDGIQISPSISEIRKGRVKCLIENKGPDAVRLPEDMNLARLEAMPKMTQAFDVGRAIIEAKNCRKIRQVKEPMCPSEESRAILLLCDSKGDHPSKYAPIKSKPAHEITAGLHVEKIELEVSKIKILSLVSEASGKFEVGPAMVNQIKKEIGDLDFLCLGSLQRSTKDQLKVLAKLSAEIDNLR